MTLVAQVKENLEDNDYWTSLMLGLQQERCPKSLASIKNIPEMYADLDHKEVQAVVCAALKDFEDRLVVCKGFADPDIVDPIVSI